ncbi:MAG: DUF3168 domain-containing protein [Pseudomonadota bacterium]
MIATDALYETLRADATLTGLIATDLGAPAIFTSYRVPEDVPRPYIVIGGVDGDRPRDAIGADIRDVDRMVHCVADNTGSVALIEQITERVRGLLHRQRLTVPGADFVWMTVQNIATQPTDESLVGRVLTIRLSADVT